MRNYRKRLTKDNGLVNYEQHPVQDAMKTEQSCSFESGTTAISRGQLMQTETNEHGKKACNTFNKPQINKVRHFIKGL